MKKILVLILATLMCISLCACGGNESTSGDNKDDITPNQPTETTETDTNKDTVDTSNMTVEEMQTYYDTTTFVGTPRIGKCMISLDKRDNSMYYQIKEDVEFADGYPELIQMEYTDELDPGEVYECIIIDNNTPDAIKDDVVAYIFPTPVE